jgi:signal transduction histidine kinase
MRGLLLGLFLLLLSTLLRAETPPVITFDQGQITVLRDKSKQLTLEQARAAHAKGQFKALAGNLGLGYIPDAVWLRLSISQDHPAARWLEVIPPYLDDIRLFHIRPGGKIDERRGGDRLPQSAKEEPYRGHLFKLDLQPGDHEIFIRLQTTSTMTAIVKLWQPRAFEQHIRSSYFGFGLYFSLILTVLLFNAANWLVSRRTIFLVYVGYLLILALQWLTTNGLTAELLLPAQPELVNLTLGLLISLGAAMAWLFFMMILELKQYHPFLYRFSQFGIVFSLVTFVATLLGHYQIFMMILMLTGTVSLFTVPWPMWRLWKTGEIWTRLLALAYFLYASLILTNILGNLAILPFSEWSFRAGMASNIAHILFLHFGIMLHYRSIEADHADALEKSALAQRQAALDRSYREDQDKLLAMITHEIRTPIAVIDAATQTLEALDDTPSADREERYDRIRRSIDRLSVLLDLAVAQTRSEVADWQLTRGTIEPTTLTNEVVTLLGNPLAQRIQITSVHALPTIVGDERMLRFALLNVLDNAAKYSPPETPVRVHIESGDQCVIWRVEDDGPGIAPGMEEKIFGKYVRAGESAGKAGLGLGLYLARDIVERHGGTLKVETGRAQGACFVCWLPTFHQGVKP